VAVLRATSLARMSAATRRTQAEYSRGKLTSRAVPRMEKPLRAGFLALGAVGALALIIADFSTLYEVKAITASLKKVTGHSQHTFGLVLLGLFALAMVWAAGVGRSRPATIALAATGGIPTLIVLIGDLNNVTSTGVYGRNYSDPKAPPRARFYPGTPGAPAPPSPRAGPI